MFWKTNKELLLLVESKSQQTEYQHNKIPKSTDDIIDSETSKLLTLMNQIKITQYW